MGSSNALDARAQAMRAVFEQTRGRAAGKQSSGDSSSAWNTSVGAEAMDAIFSTVFACAAQEASVVDKGANKRPILRSRIPRRDEALTEGQHARIIRDLMKAHRMPS